MRDADRSRRGQGAGWRCALSRALNVTQRLVDTPGARDAANHERAAAKKRDPSGFCVEGELAGGRAARKPPRYVPLKRAPQGRGADNDRIARLKLIYSSTLGGCLGARVCLKG